tara:strand:- start:557 stop:691 length:135 start_codon:yes stop_codon:yes gene_type:complete
MKNIKNGVDFSKFINFGNIFPRYENKYIKIILAKRTNNFIIYII